MASDSASPPSLALQSDRDCSHAASFISPCRFARKLFPTVAERPPLSSHSHLLAAAGSYAVIFSKVSLQKSPRPAEIGAVASCSDGDGGLHVHGADQAPASGEGPRRQGGGGAPGEGQVPAADLPDSEQHHHAPAPLQGRPPGHQGRLRPVRRGFRRHDRQRRAAELSGQAPGPDVRQGGRRLAPLLRHRPPGRHPVPGVRRPPLPHVPALRPGRHAPRLRVRVGEAQLRLRRAHRRLPLLRQGRRRQDEEERRHPEDERGVPPGEDAQPHNGAAIQGDGPQQEREGEPQGVPLLHNQMGRPRDRRRRCEQ